MEKNVAEHMFANTAFARDPHFYNRYLLNGSTDLVEHFKITNYYAKVIYKYYIIIIVSFKYLEINFGYITNILVVNLL